MESIKLNDKAHDALMLANAQIKDGQKSIALIVAVAGVPDGWAYNMDMRAFVPPPEKPKE